MSLKLQGDLLESVLVEQWTPYTAVSISWDLTDCADSWDIFVEDRYKIENYFDKEVDTGCREPIKDYIKLQFMKDLLTKTMINRVNMSISDTRVHARLYFISSTGHPLKLLDIEFMKHLQHSINII